MNEIMKKTYELIDVLEDSELIKNLEIYRERVMKNLELQELIQQGNSLNDDYSIALVKKKLYGNKDYQSYMDSYNQLMYMVMDINYRYRKLLGKGSCYR